MEHKFCYFKNCQKKAKFKIQFQNNLYDLIYSCEKHLLILVENNLENRIYIINEVNKTFCNSVQKQINDWLNGNSIHNTERDECCPDFSCCQPELKWEYNKRLQFKEHPELRGTLLIESLLNLYRNDQRR